MALRVGLTGGIASGKSTVAQQFAALGIPIIDADQVGRELLVPPSPLLEQLLARFDPLAQQRYGAPLRRPDGTLNRPLLRRLVFEDHEQRRALEALLHPAIRIRSEALAATAGGPYQLHVVPLLIETHAEHRYDRVLVVDCPVTLQLQRLQAREHIDAQQAQAMLAAQVSRERRLAAADDVILNEGPPEALRLQVQRLDTQYRSLPKAAL